jgi:hypothetical protein
LREIVFVMRNLPLENIKRKMCHRPNLNHDIVAVEACQSFGSDWRFKNLGETRGNFHPSESTMGNQHSVPDKEREKEKEKEKEKDRERERERGREPVRTTTRHEKHRSKAITPTPLPPEETKVNAEQTHNAPITSTTTSMTNNISSESKISHATPPKQLPSAANTTPRSIQTTPVKDRRMSKTKDIVDAVKNINLKGLPRPNEEEIKKEAETEHTPIFETMRAPSQTSLVDEDELKEANKSSNTFPVGDQLIVGSEKVPLLLDWNEGGKKVAVVGTFTGWQKRINLKKTYSPM